MTFGRRGAAAATPFATPKPTESSPWAGSPVGTPLGASTPYVPSGPRSVGLLKGLFLWIPEAEAPGVLAVLVYLLRQATFPLLLVLGPMLAFILTTHAMPRLDQLVTPIMAFVFGCMALIQELNRYAFVRSAEKPLRAMTIFCAVTICGIVVIYHSYPYTMAWSIAAQLAASAALLWGLRQGIRVPVLLAALVTAQTLVSITAPQFFRPPQATPAPHAISAAQTSSAAPEAVDATPPNVGTMQSWVKLYPSATVVSANTQHILGMTDWRVQFKAEATPDQVRSYYDGVADQSGFKQRQDFGDLRTYIDADSQDRFSIFVLQDGDGARVVLTAQSMSHSAGQ
jgi:hypothetical protein